MGIVRTVQLDTDIHLNLCVCGVKDMLDPYQIIRKVAMGASSQIYKVTKDDQVYAAKIARRGYRSSTIRELSIVMNFEHPNILSPVDIVTVDSIYANVAIIYPLGGQDLAIKLSGNGVADAERHVASLISVLDLLHKHDICHGDIKPSNVLCYQGKLMLIDYGACIHPFVKHVESQAQPYASPEALTNLHRAMKPNSDNVDYKAIDVWAMGCLIAYITSGNEMFEGSELDDAIHPHQRYFKDRISYLTGKNVPSKWHRLIISMLDRDARARPTTACLMADPLFSSVPRPTGVCWYPSYTRCEAVTLDDECQRLVDKFSMSAETLMLTARYHREAPQTPLLVCLLLAYEVNESSNYEWDVSDLRSIEKQVLDLAAQLGYAI